MVDLERRRLMWLIILRVTWRLFDSTLQKRGVVISRHDVLLGIGVAFAEFSGHPHTISSLAAATPTSRATAMRWADRMERAADLTVPLTVDVGIGENWMDAKG